MGSVFGVHDPNGMFATQNASVSVPDKKTNLSFQCGRDGVFGVFATPASLSVLEGAEGEHFQMTTHTEVFNHSSPSTSHASSPDPKNLFTSHDPNGVFNLEKCVYPIG